LGTLALYARTVTFGFVHYDDPDCVTRVPQITAGLSWEGIVWAFQSIVVGHWKPLVSISHMADCEWFGLNAGGHHLVNAAWHAATAAMLFLALSAMTGAVWRSALVAALFAWHPLRVESVAWITERKDVMSGFFAMAVLWSYARHVASPSPWRGALVTVMFALGLMTKSSLVTLPFALVLLDVWPLRRLRPWNTQGNGITLGAALAETAPLFLLSAAASVIAYQSATASNVGVSSLDQIPVGLRLSNAAVACIEYLRLTVWPAGLAVFYPYVKLAAWKGLLAAAALGAVTAWTVWQARTRPHLLVGWFWFLGMLTPMIGLVQSGGQAYADRYTYLAHIGLWLAAVRSLHEWAGKTGRARLAQVIGAIAVGACAAGTLVQLPHWRDSFTLFERAAAVTRDNWTAHGNLGFLHLQDGRSAQAVPHLQKAVRIVPRDANFRFNLGLALDRSGRTEEAMAQLREAARLNPGFLDAHRPISSAARRLSSPAEAAAHLRQTARLDASAAPRVELGVVLAELGRTNEAMASYTEALARDPNEPVAHANLAALLSDAGQHERAMPHFEAAIRLQPTNAVTRFNLAVSLLRQQRDREAVEQLRESVRLQPRGLNALNRLAWVLATSPDDSVRNSPEALRLADAVHEQTGRKQAMSFDTLAAALAENGRFNDAADVATQGASLASAAGQSQLASAIQARAERYRAGQPHRDGPVRGQPTG